MAESSAPKEGVESTMPGGAACAVLSRALCAPRDGSGAAGSSVLRNPRDTGGSRGTDVARDFHGARGADVAQDSCGSRGSCDSCDSSRPLIDALAWFARAYPGDIAYLHGVGPETPDALARAEGSRDESESEAARQVAAAREEAPVRARYAMLGMRSYRRSHDAPHGCGMMSDMVAAARDDASFGACDARHDDAGSGACDAHDDAGISACAAEAGQSCTRMDDGAAARTGAPARIDECDSLTRSVMASCGCGRHADAVAHDGVDLGAIGYCAYDGGDDGGFPSQWRWFDRWIVEDHATGTVTAIALGHLGPAQDAVRELREQWESWNAACALGARACAPGDDRSGANHTEPNHTKRRKPATSHDSFAGTPATRTRTRSAAHTATDAAIAGADQNRDGYMAAVRHMQRHMRDGDIYVANMSMRLDVRTPVPPVEAFRRLFADNPSPYAAYLDFRDDGVDYRESADCDDRSAAAHGDRANASGFPDDGAATDDVGRTGGAVDGRREPGAGAHMGPVVVGSSPERFLRIWDGVAVTEPIKGTRPRGRDAAEDARLAADLHTSAKEQAELLMVTDLERNDMNRFCEPGSVVVPAYEEVRAFPHVFHTVSVVEGRPRAGTDVAAALRVMSPGGSITGTPKRRAMEIIGECERSPRGVYTGGLGYVGVDPAAWLARTQEYAAMHGDEDDVCAASAGADDMGLADAVSGGSRAARDRASQSRAPRGCEPWTADARSTPLPQVCDLGIVIRTAVMMGEGVDGTSRLYAYRIGAGGGVTLESDPAAEWDEAVHKARAVLAALGVSGLAVDAFARSSSGIVGLRGGCLPL